MEVPKRKRVRSCLVHTDDEPLSYRKPKINTDLIWLPLEYNKEFHGEIMKRYSTSSVLTVSYREGKFRIGLMRKADEIIIKDKACSFGGDVGTARWLLALRGEDGASLGIEADQKCSDTVMKKLMKIDKKLSEAAILKNSGRIIESMKKEGLAHRQMKNVVEANQWFMEIFVSRMLNLMESNNIFEHIQKN